MWTRLPLEIDRIIFECIDERQDLLALVGICKAFRSEIERLLYRVVLLRIDGYYSSFFSVIVARPEIARQVQSLTLSGKTKYSAFPFDSFAQALGLLDTLKSLTFDYQTSFFDDRRSIAERLFIILDSTSVNFQLSAFRDRTFSLRFGLELEIPVSYFFKNQRELREIQLAVGATRALEPSALLNLNSIFTTLPCAKHDVLYQLLRTRSITHLKFSYFAVPIPPLPPIPSLQFLSILSEYAPSRLSELFPQLRALECSFALCMKRTFLENIGNLKNLTALTLLGVADGRPVLFSMSILDNLTEDIFSCNPSLTTFRFAGRSSLPSSDYTPPIYPILLFKRGDKRAHTSHSDSGCNLVLSPLPF